jgi:CheY-like chemotaxis protein
LPRQIDILLIEDDDDDVRLAKKAFEKDHLCIRIHRVQDGIEAMAYLKREGNFASAMLPKLILLDLNMPRRGGHELLKEIKADSHLRRIPVVVLTTSDDEQDIALSYEYRANSYVTKPADLDEFREILTTLKDYWFGIVRLPPPCSTSTSTNAPPAEVEMASADS